MAWFLRRERLLLTLLCAALYLPGLSAIPPLDRDESFFAQASKQMVETGDFIGIYFRDQPRNKKPAGIHWLQVAAVELIRGGPSTDIWLYRLPSAIGAWIAVLFTFALGCVLFTRTAALWGAALLACCVGLVVEAHMATTDAVLLATVTAAQWVLATAYVRTRSATSGEQRLSWPAAVLFWSALGVGTLIKGPVTAMVAMLTAISLSIGNQARQEPHPRGRWHWLRSLRPAAGLSLLALWVLPWFVAVTLFTDTHFLARALAEDLLPKVVAGQESHGGPPGYHLALMTVFSWPASLFLFPAALGAWKARHTASVQFCLAWLLPSWIVFELVPTKLPHYVLPTYPALALLIGAALAGAIAADFSSRLLRGSAVLSIIVAALLSMGLGVAGLYLGDGGIWWIVLTCVALLAAGTIPARLLLRNQPVCAGVAAIVTATSLMACLAAVYAPHLAQLWLSPAVAEAIERAEGDTHPFVIAVGYHEPSLVFLLGTRTALLDPIGGARVAAEHPGSIAVVSSSSEPEFLAALARSGAEAQLVASLAGLNYTKGQPLLLNLFRISKGARP